MAGILDRFPQWRQYWGMIQQSAARYGVDPNETLAVHIFENTAANPDASSSVGALGLAQIFDRFVSRTTNSRHWKQFAARWGFKGDKAALSDAMKRDPAFAIDYLAWRMAGTRDRYKDGPLLSGLDQWYRSGGYNPGFSGDSRGDGPSIYVANNSMGVAGTPFPVTGGNWSFSSHWGDDRDGGSRQHKGVDVAAPHGTPLVAVADGKVALRTGGSGGNAVWINGKFYYAHLSRFAVKNGERVRKGQVIGYVGSSGTSSTGPHLHFGIDPRGTFGQSWVNPLKFLQRAEASSGGVYGEEHDAGQPAPSAFDLFFQGESLIPLPAGGIPLPAGGPGLPAAGSPQGLGFQRRDMGETWRLIARQEDVSDETLRFAGLLDEESL